MGPPNDIVVVTEPRFDVVIWNILHAPMGALAARSVASGKNPQKCYLVN